MIIKELTGAGNNRLVEVDNIVVVAVHREERNIVAVEED
jgi:hypothetical protein